jgi:multidrug efflux system membrane fusion protein
MSWTCTYSWSDEKNLLFCHISKIYNSRWGGDLHLWEVQTGMHLTIRSKSSRACAWILCAVALLFSLLFSGCAGQTSPAPAAKKGPGSIAVPVTAAQVSRKDVPVEIQVVGNVESSLTVAVKSQVSGEITQVFFQEGDFVKKDDQLFAIDARTYQGQVNQLQANLARDQASLAQIESNLARDQAQEKYAQATAARSASLFERNLVARVDVEQTRTSADAIAATVRADMAAIQSARATIEATRASLENAKVLLGYTVIRSPIHGRTGSLEAKQGNVVSTNTTLMTIHQVEPVFVTFAVPEARLKSVRTSQTVIATTQDDPSSPQSGRVIFIDNAVDATTGTIRIKGTFPNANHRLWPGQFARVTLRLETLPNALVVPRQAVQTGQEGMYVFVVKPDRTVESRKVTVGQQTGEEVVIENGLADGETVVVEGQLRLAPGSRVQLAGAAADSPRRGVEPQEAAGEPAHK